MQLGRVENLVVQVGSLAALEAYLRLAMTTVLTSCDEIAVKAVDRSDPRYSISVPSVVSNKEKHFPVILIGGWFYSKADDTYPYFENERFETFRSGDINATDKAITHIKELLKANESTWCKGFVANFGGGYNLGFNEFDGSVEVGYELRSCHQFPEKLAISLCHIYYGK